MLKSYLLFRCCNEGVRKPVFFSLRIQKKHGKPQPGTGCITPKTTSSTLALS